MGAGAIWKKPDVGFGAGVRPSDSLIGSPSSYGYDINIGQQGKVGLDVRKNATANASLRDKPSGLHPGVESGYQGGMSKGYIDEHGDTKGWGHWYPASSGHRNSATVNEIPTMDRVTGQYTAADLEALQIEYDTDEALRQDKLDRMSQLAQGQGGGGGGVSASKVGNAGNLDVEHTPMMRGEDGFPTLADFEQPLHPFLGKRRQRYS